MVEMIWLKWGRHRCLRVQPAAVNVIHILCVLLLLSAFKDPMIIHLQNISCIASGRIIFPFSVIFKYLWEHNYRDVQIFPVGNFHAF